MPRKKKTDQSEENKPLNQMELKVAEHAISMIQIGCPHRDYWQSKEEAEKFCADELKRLQKAVYDESVDPLNYLRIAARITLATLWIRDGAPSNVLKSLQSDDGDSCVECSICKKRFYPIPDEEYLEHCKCGENE